jgi:hypothetical protein
MRRRDRFFSFVQLLLSLATLPLIGGFSEAADVPAAAVGTTRPSALGAAFHDVVLPSGRLHDTAAIGVVLGDSLMGDMVLNEIGAEIGASLATARLDPIQLESRHDRVSGTPAAWGSLGSDGQGAQLAGNGERATSPLSLARPQITSLTTGRQVGASARSRAAAANDVLPLSREIFPLLVNAIPDHASFTLAGNRLPNSAAVVGVRPAYLKPAAFR